MTALAADANGDVFTLGGGLVFKHTLGAWDSGRSGSGRGAAGDLKAVAVAVAVVGGEGHPGGQIDVDGNRGPGLPGRARGASRAVPSRERHPPRQASRGETPRKVPGSHLFPEETLNTHLL